MINYLFALLLVLCPLIAHAEVIAEKRSLYQKIYITQDNNLKCMSFRSPSWGVLEQSCIDVNQPQRLVFDYYQGIAASLLAVRTKPQRILVLGLGGGVMPTYLSQQYPMATIHTVEIDPAVVNMAINHFGYVESDNMKTFTADGRVFVKRAQRNRQRYDVVILDAFGGDYIPEHMMTQEFLNEIKEILSVNGIVISNTFSDSQLYHHESETYAQVFGEFYQLQISDIETNRVIMASNQPLDALAPKIPSTFNIADFSHRYGFDPKSILTHWNKSPTWDRGVKPLTDQFSPANLLKHQGN